MDCDSQGILELQSQDLLVRVDLSRGGHIFHLEHRALGGNLLYEDPRGLRNHLIGGWFELLPNAGPPSADPPAPSHGDIKDVAWELSDEGRTETEPWIQITARSRILPIRITRTMRIRGNCLEVRSRLDAESPHEFRYLWGQHITFGSHVLTPDLRIEVEAKGWHSRSEFASASSRIRPEQKAEVLDRLPALDGSVLDGRRVAGLIPPVQEMLFASGATGHAVLRTAQFQVIMRWDPVAYPAVWLWVEDEGPHATAPNAIRALAIEPQSSVNPGLDAAIASDEAPTLRQGQPQESWVTLHVHPTDK